MKLNLPSLALSLTLGFVSIGFAQTKQKSFCGTYAAMEQRFIANPEAKQQFEKSQQQLRELNKATTTSHIGSKVAAVQYTIPTVFHVLHTGGAENLSDATITSALAQVNSDYARTGNDANTVAAPFVNLYINSDIKFMLAHKDQNGNCTNGIVHHYDMRTEWNSLQANYTGLTWDPTKYLNIIIVKAIDGGGSLIGYTWLPGTWGDGASQDAIVYDGSFLGGLNTRSLSHEIGHWLNLPHTFGNTNDPGQACGDDGIADTPATMGTFGCPSSLSGNTCDAGGTDNVENIMNYSSCPKNFTSDQTDVMRAALVSNVSGRNNLWSPANLTATDVNGAGSCAPICEFLSSNNTYTVCSGGSLTMKDFSYNGAITSWSWSATNANIASSSASITAVAFPTVGTSIITLTVTNGQGSATQTRTVTVLNGAVGVPGNYGESFESPGVPTGWVVTNPNNGSVFWDQTQLAASDGLSSFYINGPSNITNHIDYLQMPMIDALSHPNHVLNFKYAYARYSTSNNDKLDVQASTDCGGTWQTILGLSAGFMAGNSGGVSATPFVPSASQWTLYTISDHPNWFNYTNSSNVLVRFKFTEDAGGVGFGNRLFIDEINFGDPNGVNELTQSISFNLYPNPTNGEATIKFNLHDAAIVDITVSDVLGKNVITPMSYSFAPGQQDIIVNKSNTLSKGIYFVNLSLNGAKMSRKLVVN